VNQDISVIQGSILGPILFFFYINNFWLDSSLLSVLFGYDAACLGKGKNLNELTTNVSQELNKIANWFRVNNMSVNMAKNKFIGFLTRGKNNKPC
jgi:mannose/fructose/N-acetylgalactosamine-specific phosphotransferase system component IID